MLAAYDVSQVGWRQRVADGGKACGREALSKVACGCKYAGGLSPRYILIMKQVV